MNANFDLVLEYLPLLLCRIVVGNWNFSARVNSLYMLEVLVGGRELRHSKDRMASARASSDVNPSVFLVFVF